MMKINMGALTRDMLEDLVDEGDVQTACTMLLVLEKKLTKTIDPMVLGDQEINWFHSYIELLSRFQLWSVQAAVVAMAPDAIKVCLFRYVSFYLNPVLSQPFNLGVLVNLQPYNFVTT